MPSVDSRIVNMQFNNSQFESGIKTSVNSLTALKNGLNLDKSAASLNNLQQAGNSFSLANMANGIESINSKLTLLGAVGVAALLNISSAAITAGTNLVKSLTIDPIMTGLQEYETKMNAIQTILTNTKTKGSTLDDVNKALNELNTYSDQTIYNFAEMAKNIGTFTAAGVDLKTSTDSIKGIANLAAGSGSSALQASTAMYQLSQAIASGSVKLMDWNSVVNAGMGGELFQNALKDTAKGMGIVVKAGVPFRETLKDGWLTSEVLTKTLSKFANDPDLIKAATQVKTFSQLINTMQESVQSGWAQSWENIIGNKDEAAAFFTEVNNGFGNIVGGAAKARNEMLAFWKANGGRDALILGLKNAFDSLMSIMTPIGQAFREIFPKTTAQGLIDLTVKFRDFMASLKLSDKTANNLKATFKGFFAILDIGKQAFMAIAGVIGAVIQALLPVGDYLLGVTGQIGNFFVGLDQSIKTSGFFVNAVTGVVNALKFLGSGVTNIVTKIQETFATFGKLDFSGLTTISDKVKLGFEPVLVIIGVVGKAFDKLSEGMMKAFSGITTKRVFDVVNGGLIAGILLGIKKLIGALKNMVEDTNFLDRIKGILDGVRGSLESFQNSLKAKTLMNIAIAIAILAASLVILSLIDDKRLSSALGAMTGVFIELVAAMGILSKLTAGAGIGQLIKLGVAMTTISTAVLILSFAMLNFGKLKWDEVAKGITSIAALTTILVLTSKALAANKGSMIQGAGSLVIFAAAMNLLATACRNFGTMDWDMIVKGLVSVGVLCAEIALFLNFTTFSEKAIANATGILILSVAMNVLATACRNFGTMDWTMISKGMISVGILLTEIGIFSRLTGESKQVMATGASLILISVALNLLATALRNFGTMSPNELMKGFMAMGTALAFMAIGLKAMEGTLSGSAALLVAAIAFNLLVPVLILLGNMSWDAIVKGLTSLAGVFVVLGFAGVILGPLVPVIYALAGSIALIGVGVALAGAGLVLMSVGVTALALALSTGAVVIAAGIVIIINAIVGMIPIIIQKLGEGIVLFCQTLTDSADTIALTVLTLVATILDTFYLIIPEIVNFGLNLITTLLNALILNAPIITLQVITIILEIVQVLTDNMPKIVDAGVNLVLAFLQGIQANMNKIVEAGFQLIISFLNGVTNSINNNKQAFVDAVQNLVLAMMGAGKLAVTDSIKDFEEAGKNVVAGFIRGITGAIAGAAAAAAEMGRAALVAAKAALVEKSPSRAFMQVGAYAGEGLVIGLNSYNDKAAKAGAEVATNALDGLSGAIAGISDAVDGNMDLQPTITPVLDLTNIQNGSKQMNGMMAGVNGLSIAGSISASQKSRGGNSEKTNSSSTPGSQANGGLTVVIENFNNARGQDVQALAEELSFYMRQKNLGLGVG